MTKLISWNVNGLRACEGKGFSESFRQLDADFFCLQETKMQQGQLDLSFDGYESYWNYADKKGYSGTAIFTRRKPINVTYGIGIDEHDHEGRVITLETEDFFLVDVYTPNSQDGLKRLDYRMKWEDDFRAYLMRLDGSKPVVVCGDMNVAHQEIDLKTRKATAATPDSLTRSARSSANCWPAASPTRSGCCTPSRLPTHGGRTVSRQGRRTQGGASTTLSPRNASTAMSRRQAYTTRYTEATTALLSLCSTFSRQRPTTTAKRHTAPNSARQKNA